MGAQDEKTQKAIASELRALRCTANLPMEALNLLASIAVKRKYANNEFVWEMGDPGEFFAIVLSGLIEITRYSNREEEMAMGIFGPSDAIGISAVIKKTPYPGNAKSVVSGTEVLKLYIRPILPDKSPLVQEIQTWIREMMLQHEQILRDKIDILNAGGIEDRVFELITHLNRRFGQHESAVRHSIPIRLTRAQVGKFTDARVESVIRLISRWQRQKLIHWDKDGIQIENLALLEKSLSKNRRLK